MEHSRPDQGREANQAETRRLSGMGIADARKAAKAALAGTSATSQAPSSDAVGSVGTPRPA